MNEIKLCHATFICKYHKNNNEHAKCATAVIKSNSIENHDDVQFRDSSAKSNVIRTAFEPMMSETRAMSNMSMSVISNDEINSEVFILQLSLLLSRAKI